MLQNVHGRPDSRAHGDLTVVGYCNGIDGTWKIARAEHLLNQNGLCTKIECYNEENMAIDPNRGTMG